MRKLGNHVIQNAESINLIHSNSISSLFDCILKAALWTAWLMLPDPLQIMSGGSEKKHGDPTKRPHPKVWSEVGDRRTKKPIRKVQVQMQDSAGNRIAVSNNWSDWKSNYFSTTKIMNAPSEWKNIGIKQWMKKK